MRSKITSAALCVAAFWSGAAIAAQPASETVVTGEARPTAIVHYGDLDLSGSAGIAVLNSRVYRAATRLCIEPGLQPVSWLAAGRECQREALAGAQPQVDAAIASYSRGGRLAAAALVVTATAR